MEGESGFTRSIVNELHSSDIQQDHIEGKRSFTRRIIDEIFFSDIQ